MYLLQLYLLKRFLAISDSPGDFTLYATCPPLAHMTTRQLQSSLTLSSSVYHLIRYAALFLPPTLWCTRPVLPFCATLTFGSVQRHCAYVHAHGRDGDEEGEYGGLTSPWHTKLHMLHCTNTCTWAWKGCIGWLQSVMESSSNPSTDFFHQTGPLVDGVFTDCLPVQLWVLWDVTVGSSYDPASSTILLWPAYGTVSIITKLASFMLKDRPWYGPHTVIFIYCMHKTCITTPTHEYCKNMLQIFHPFLFVTFAALQEV